MTLSLSAWRMTRHGLVTLLAMCAWTWACLAWSADALITRTEPLIIDGQLTMDLDASMTLSPVVRDAAERGVPLYFTVDLKITAARWWWFNKVLAEATLTRRVTYNALTRQWRVASGDLFLPVASLEEALSVIRQVRAWPIAPIDQFEPDTRYDGQVRIRLDTSQLARPMRLDATNRGAWSLASPWAPFDFSIRQQEPAQ